MAKVFLRVNQVGWVHIWAREEAFYEGEPSVLFFNRKADPRWPELSRGLEAAQREALEAGELVALEENGLLADELGVD